MWWFSKIPEGVSHFLFPSQQERRDEGKIYTEQWNVKCGKLPDDPNHIWSSNDQEIYCSTSYKIFRLICEPADIQECAIPPLTYRMDSVKTVGDLVFTLQENGELVCLHRSPDNPAKFDLQWSQNIDYVIYIQDILIRDNNLCIKSKSMLVFLDVVTGEVLFKTRITAETIWDIYRSFLLIFESKYIHFHQLRLGKSYSLDIHALDINPKGVIQNAKIQQDDGSIFIVICHHGVQRLYKLSPKKFHFSSM
jgi:hypothetical protein